MRAVLPGGAQNIQEVRPIARSGTGRRGAGDGTRQRTPAPRLALAGLAVILLVYGSLAVAQCYATRLQWGPDEPAHMVYVQSVGLDGRLPVLVQDGSADRYHPGTSRTYQAHHPPLYYVLAGGVWRLFSGRPPETVSYADPRTRETQRFAAPGAARPVRLFSVLLGAVSLLFVWAAARTLCPDRPAVWLGATALLAFTPMFTYLNSVISNDPLTVVAFAATGWAWARALRFGLGWRGAALVGLFAGAGMSVKETAAALLPISLVVVLVAPGSGRGSGRLARAGAFALPAVVAGGWWAVRKWIVYGSPIIYAYHLPLLGLPPEQRALLGLALPAQVFLFTFLPLDVVQSHVPIPALAGWFGVVTALSLAGIGVALLRRGGRALPRHEAWYLALAVLAAATVLAGLVRNVLLVDWRMGTAGGRFMVPALPLLALASARGICTLLGDGVWAKLVLALIALGLIAANLLVISATAAEYGTLWR